MCLGAQARAANERARRDYEYNLEKRERDWMQTLGMTKVEHLQYQQTIDSSNLGLANVYSDIQEQQYEAVNTAMAESQQDWKSFLADNTGDQLKAKGRIGRSAMSLMVLALAVSLWARSA